MSPAARSRWRTRTGTSASSTTARSTTTSSCGTSFNSAVTCFARAATRRCWSTVTSSGVRGCWSGSTASSRSHCTTAARRRCSSRATASESCRCITPNGAGISFSRPRSRRSSQAERWSRRSTPRGWTKCSPSGRPGRRVPRSGGSGRSSRGRGRGGGTGSCRSAGTTRSTGRRRQRIGGGEIARVFPDVVRHAETPLLRTAPAPLYLLSRLTREQGIKVVLTGEGSDEVFLGYDLFKETLVRLFCLRQPDSRWRPRLFDRLYGYLPPQARKGDFWRRFFLNAGSPDDPLFSHLPRFRLTTRIRDFYGDAFRGGLGAFDALGELRQSLPAGFMGWSPLGRAAYLEIVTLLSPYLLAAQGDRMAMAHGVEARVPFLDHRLVEFAVALPDRSRLCGLREKAILRRWAAGRLPRAITGRLKQPYRAPDVPAFFGGTEPEYVGELLDAASVRRTGIFNPDAVAGLVRRCRARLATGVGENQALVAILSTELWHREFLGAPARARAPALSGAQRAASGASIAA